MLKETISQEKQKILQVLNDHQFDKNKISKSQ